jgi:4-hydroxybenzoate polyprenyltransferase
MSMLKKILYNSVTVNLPKNIFQLMLGVILFVVVFGYPDITKLLMAIAGLGLAYSSVYIYNDIIDRDEDRHDPQKSGQSQARDWPLELSHHPTTALTHYFAYSVARVSRMTVTLI